MAALSGLGRGLLAASVLLQLSAAEESFCCLAASDPDDVCGSCFPAAIAHPDSECGLSKDACAACGDGTHWCQGDGAPASQPAAAVEAPPRAALDEPAPSVQPVQPDAVAPAQPEPASAQTVPAQPAVPEQPAVPAEQAAPAAPQAVQPAQPAAAAPVAVVTDSQPQLAASSDASTTCASAGEDCSTSQCCAQAGHQCFRKNAWWAACKSTCSPGVDPSDPADAQTPWECTPLGPVATGSSGTPTSKAKEIVIMLDSPPTGLEEGGQVTIELGGGGQHAAPPSMPEGSVQASSSGGVWLTPFLVFEGVAAVLALSAAAFYHSESQRKAQALQAVNAVGAGKASPGAASPGALERGKGVTPERRPRSRGNRTPNSRPPSPGTQSIASGASRFVLGQMGNV